MNSICKSVGENNTVEYKGPFKAFVGGISGALDGGSPMSHVDFKKSQCSMSLKPIFDCDAKYLASGVGFGQCPRRQNFALGIPTCWYLLR